MYKKIFCIFGFGKIQNLQRETKLLPIYCLQFSLKSLTWMLLTFDFVYRLNSDIYKYMYLYSMNINILLETRNCVIKKIRTSHTMLKRGKKTYYIHV